MNVLAIGCHPDDIEVSCAGTLARYAKEGHNVTVCHVANGNLGHAVIMPDELREMRAVEAQNAGNLADIKVVNCDIGDLMVYEGSKEQRDKVVDIIRQSTPDVIITHSPTDYMPDHLAVSRLVFDATFAASVPHYETAIKAVAAVTPVKCEDIGEFNAYMGHEIAMQIKKARDSDEKLAMILPVGPMGMYRWAAEFAFPMKMCQKVKQQSPSTNAQ